MGFLTKRRQQKQEVRDLKEIAQRWVSAIADAQTEAWTHYNRGDWTGAQAVAYIYQHLRAEGIPDAMARDYCERIVPEYDAKGISF